MPSINGSVFIILLWCFITIVLYHILKYGVVILPTVIVLFGYLCSGFFLLFWIFFVLYGIQAFFQFLWRILLGYWLGLIYICIFLLVVWPFQSISPSSPWASDIFTTFGISSISFLSHLHFHVNLSIP